MPVAQHLGSESLQAVVDLRHDFHKHPELGFQEFRTQERLQAWLIDCGFSTRVCAETGLIVDVRPDLIGKAPTIALRADIDCLPMDERTPLPYRSIHPGRAHKCGHDGHAAILAGVARVLSKTKDSLQGNVRLIFQPAEEGERGGGAQVMVQEGALEQVDEVYGLHNWPGYPAGEMRVCSGAIMAAVCDFDIIVTGRGGHAGLPQNCIDPLAASARLISQLHELASRDLGSAGKAVLSICEIRGGEARNVIPGEVKMAGTLRSFGDDVDARMQRRMQEVCDGLALATGTKIELILMPSYPVLVNDDGCAQAVASVGAEVLGSEKVSARDLPMAGAEDFAYFTRAVPGAYFFLGAGKPGEFTPGCHHPDFDFDDSLIAPAIDIFLRIVERRISALASGF